MTYIEEIIAKASNRGLTIDPSISGMITPNSLNLPVNAISNDGNVVVAEKQVSVYADDLTTNVKTDVEDISKLDQSDASGSMDNSVYYLAGFVVLIGIVYLLFK
jgi:hypothetical protein